MKMDEVRAAIQNGEDVVVSIHEPTVAGEVEVRKREGWVSLDLKGAKGWGVTVSNEEFCDWDDERLKAEVIQIIHNSSW